MAKHRSRILPIRRHGLASFVAGLLASAYIIAQDTDVDAAARPPGSAAPDPQGGVLIAALVVLIVVGAVSCRMIAKRHGVANRSWYGTLGTFVPIVFFILGGCLVHEPRSPLAGGPPLTPSEMQSGFLIGLVGCGIATLYTYMRTKPSTPALGEAGSGRFCISCGAPTTAGQKFCASCGAAQA